MNDVQIFNSEEFGEIRTVVIDGDPWFVGADIAKSLGYVEPRMAISNHCKHAIKHSIPHPQSEAKTIEVLIIPESDLYRLVMKSQLPSAESFSDWVFEDVLHSLRKNGTYSVLQKQDSYMIEDPVERAKRWIEEQEEKKLLEQKIVEQKPKADYFDQLVDSRLLTTFRDCAKEFNIPPNAFTQWLRDQGYIYNDSHNIIKPYAPYVKDGLFQMKDFKTPHGYSNVQTYIAVKGKETFRLLLEIYNGKPIEELSKE